MINEDCKTIYKYGPLIPSETPTVFNKIPVDGKIRHFGMQGGQLYIWVEVYADEAKKQQPPRGFYVVGTGWEIPENTKWTGTVVCENGLVWHLYETFERLI